MTLPINLSTGPVGVSAEVMKGLSEPPLSHRSAAFRELYNKTTDMLCREFQVQETFLLTGSGTMANECMLQEIKNIDGPGLILSNGEFGSRLLQQSLRNNISFIPYQLEWGKKFDLSEVEILVNKYSIRWILFCHCETSTGMINDFEKIAILSKIKHCLCFVDCMSTVGTVPLNLSAVTMATASSGKGLGSIPGLGIVFSNWKPTLKKEGSVYLDLANYAAYDGIPFTISSNLLKALYVSICQKLNDSQYSLLQEYGEKFYSILNGYNVVPFSHYQTKVFTIVPVVQNKLHFMKPPADHRLLLSHESDYLKKRGWYQLAIFGYYSKSQLKMAVKCLTS